MLHHPELPPEAVSAGLGLEPNIRSWRVGDRRTTPQGDSLEGVYRSTYWCSGLIDEYDMDMVENIENVLDKIEPKRDFLVQFCATGGTIELRVFWDTEEKNTGQIFDWEMFKRLAALQISIGFDVYGGRNPGK